VIRRRQFITLLGGGAAWPLAFHAQQPERVRRIGVLVHGSRSGAIWQQRLAAFRQGLEALGWQEGRNIHIETLFSDNDYDRLPRVAQELVALGPEVIFANTTRCRRKLGLLRSYSSKCPTRPVQGLSPV
jgi:putative tryptophan/tyrosine transport system substrate-binding protein